MSFLIVKYLFENFSRKNDAFCTFFRFLVSCDCSLLSENCLFLYFWKISITCVYVFSVCLIYIACQHLILNTPEAIIFIQSTSKLPILILTKSRSSLYMDQGGLISTCRSLGQIKNREHAWTHNCHQTCLKWYSLKLLVQVYIWIMSIGMLKGEIIGKHCYYLPDSLILVHYS